MVRHGKGHPCRSRTASFRGGWCWLWKMVNEIFSFSDNGGKASRPHLVNRTILPTRTLGETESSTQSSTKERLEVQQVRPSG